MVTAISQLRSMSLKEKYSFWSSHVEKFKVYKGSIEEYCKAEDLSIHTFRAWRGRVNKKNGVRTQLKPKAPRFLPAVVVDSGESQSLRREALPNPQWLAEFLGALQGAGR